MILHTSPGLFWSGLCTIIHKNLLPSSFVEADPSCKDKESWCAYVSEKACQEEEIKSQCPKKCNNCPGNI